MRLNLLAIAAFAATAQAQDFDVLIRGGTVIDGSGSARFRADVGIKGDRVITVSRTPIAANRATRVIDATGRIVAPGFIDMHAHIDPLANLPGMESAVRQGVTLSLGGPDGGSPLPAGGAAAGSSPVTPPAACSGCGAAGRRPCPVPCGGTPRSR